VIVRQVLEAVGISAVAALLWAALLREIWKQWKQADPAYGRRRATGEALYRIDQIFARGHREMERSADPSDWHEW
jgi:hypothetical protein